MKLTFALVGIFVGFAINMGANVGAHVGYINVGDINVGDISVGVQDNLYGNMHRNTWQSPDTPSPDTQATITG